VFSFKVRRLGFDSKAINLEFLAQELTNLTGFSLHVHFHPSVIGAE
jgi:hypothetical protein